MDDQARRALKKMDHMMVKAFGKCDEDSNIKSLLLFADINV